MQRILHMDCSPAGTIGIRDVHILSLEGTRRGEAPATALLATAASWAAGLV